MICELKYFLLVALQNHLPVAFRVVRTIFRPNQRLNSCSFQRKLVGGFLSRSQNGDYPEGLAAVQLWGGHHLVYHAGFHQLWHTVSRSRHTESFTPKVSRCLLSR